MNKKTLSLILFSFFMATFIGCGGGGVLSQQEMDKKIESLTVAGKAELGTMLDSACDQKFESLVQNYTDSLLTASKAEQPLDR